MEPQTKEPQPLEQHSGFFKTSVDDGVAHIELARPEKANAMTPEFWRELPKIAQELNQDTSVRAVVLSGEGKHFTSGMDLSAFQSILTLFQSEPGRAGLAMRDMVLGLQASISSLETLRVPVIAAIHGACLGGGIDLVTACDIRLATRDSFFAIEEIHIGITADVGTLQRLPKLIAPGIVRELTYTGRRFSAEEAHGWGLCNQLFDDRAALLDGAFEMARDIAAKSPLAVVGAKQAITYARDHDVADGLEQAATWNAAMLRPEDLTAAIKARIEKKEAEFADLLASPAL